MLVAAGLAAVTGFHVGAQDHEAVARAARAQSQTVYKLPAGREEPAPVEVKTGISDGRFTQVVEGQLAQGDTVVTGAATLRAQTQSGAVVGGGRGGGRRGF